MKILILFFLLNFQSYANQKWTFKWMIGGSNKNWTTIKDSAPFHVWDRKNSCSFIKDAEVSGNLKCIYNGVEIEGRLFCLDRGVQLNKTKPDVVTLIIGGKWISVKCFD